MLNNCIAPLAEFEKEQAYLLEPEIKRQRSERKSYEKIIENLRNKGAKEEDQIKQKQLIREITEREAALIEPQPLLCLFVTDITPEELASKMYEQKNYLGIFSDESGIIEVLSGLYSNGTANIDILLKGIDGGDVKVRRKDKSFNLNPLLTIVLTVQPSIIHKMSDKKTYTGNGCLERFLYVLPKSKLGYRNHNNPPVPKYLLESYHKTIRRLLDNATKQYEQTKQKITLTLSEVALKDWQAFRCEVERQLRPDGDFYILQGWAGKISGFALRIAGILHVAKEEQNNFSISGDAMARALEIATLLTQHAIAAYNLMGADQCLQDAKELFYWIEHYGNNSFTKSKITYEMRHRKLGKKERLTKALDILVERNILQEQTDRSTRKPTTIFLVNPKLVNEGKS